MDIEKWKMKKEPTNITPKMLEVMIRASHGGLFGFGNSGKTIEYGRRWNLILAVERRGMIVYEGHLWQLTAKGSDYLRSLGVEAAG